MGSDWTKMDELPALVSDEVQLWRIDLGVEKPENENLLRRSYAVLTAEERERAAKMRTGGPRVEFVIGRGSLRRFVGKAVGIDPMAVGLEKGDQGKPRLRREAGRTGVWFNVAHSRGMILIGLSMAGEIGVDVEYRDAALELEEVARTAFHDTELSRVKQGATSELRLAEFYRCWTRKEAVAKADGRGLTIEPRSYAVGPDDGAEIEALLPEAAGGQRYFVQGIDVGPSHEAAVAAEIQGLKVRWYEFGPAFSTSVGE